MNLIKTFKFLLCKTLVCVVLFTEAQADLASNTAQMHKLFVIYLGRPAAPEELKSCMLSLSKGVSLEQMAEMFFSSAEHRNLTANLTDEQMVNATYHRLFGRDANAAGLSYWADQLSTGKLNINNIALHIMHFAQGDDAVVVNNKLKAAQAFTNSLDTDEKAQAYQEDPNVGKKFLEAVTDAYSLELAKASLNNSAPNAEQWQLLQASNFTSPPPPQDTAISTATAAAAAAAAAAADSLALNAIRAY